MEMIWLKVIFSVILLGGLGIGFVIVFNGLVDEETRQQARVIRARIRADRKKAKKRAWHNERDYWFREFTCCPSKGNSAAVTAHLANKPR